MPEKREGSLSGLTEQEAKEFHGIFMTSFIVSLAALFLVGSLVSLLTGRSLLFSGFRQVGLGAAAAAITYLVGHLIGVSVA